MKYIMLNHHAVAENEALVPVADRGFRYGDGVFETIGVYNGVPYHFEWHMERLQRGLAAIRITYSTTALQQECAELLIRNQHREGLLRIQITRGASGSGYLPAGGTPTVVIETLPLTPAPDKPVSLWLSNYRRIPASSLPVESKLCQGLGSTLARMEAVQHGCFEALQVNQQGILCETSSANIFWLKGQTLYTPALDSGVLDGSMRAALTALAPYKVVEIHSLPDELEQADAVCITNAAWQVLAVDSLQPQGFSWDSAGLAAQLRGILAEDIKSYCASHRGLWQRP